MRPPGKHERLRQLEQRCRECGLALTVQRRAVLGAILDRTDHPSADQIYDEIRAAVPGISRTTVYRILDTFTRAGLIAKVGSPGAAIRFDPAGDQHHHLLCSRCDRLIDLYDDRLDRLKPPKVDPRVFEINGFSIYFRGICAACRRKCRSARKPIGDGAGRAASGAAKRRTKPRTARRGKNA